MKDILLDEDGDLIIGERGDIILANSVRQKIRIRILWFAGEWQWDKDIGLPWRENILGQKKPDIDDFESKLRESIFDVNEVVNVGDVEVTVNSGSRSAVINYVAYTDLETIREEVKIDGTIWSD